MTEQEAIETAKKVAEAEGWYWAEPCETELFRRWILGPRLWMVWSNAKTFGANVGIVIKASTGRVIRKEYIRMTEIEVIDIAMKVAEAEGWPWKEPIHTHYLNIDGRVIWQVNSNANAIGQNVGVRIEDETGKVLNAGFAPR